MLGTADRGGSNGRTGLRPPGTGPSPLGRPWPTDHAARPKTATMRVTLRWSVSGQVFQEVACDVAEWGTIVRGDAEAWSYVPTRKLHVMRDDGIILLEGLFLAAAAEVTLPIYAMPASFHNALSGVAKLPNGERRWRKEFKRHVVETYYRAPSNWLMKVQAQDFWILRMLQVWARDARIRFRPARLRWFDGMQSADLGFSGRFRHSVAELMADRFHVDDETGFEGFLRLEAVNMAAHMNLTQFLWTDENQFHCFVR